MTAGRGVSIDVSQGVLVVRSVFGRPCRWLGVSCGAGLLLSALCFGLIHALNTVDYFAGRYTVAYVWGLWAVFIGLFFGCLRERTGSILAGAWPTGLVA
jgi:membrane protease YdiL (CAAX protease family)